MDSKNYSALLDAALENDLGLCVRTNNPAVLRDILSKILGDTKLELSLHPTETDCLFIVRPPNVLDDLVFEVLEGEEA